MKKAIVIEGGQLSQKQNENKAFPVYAYKGKPVEVGSYVTIEAGSMYRGEVTEATVDKKAVIIEFENGLKAI